MAIFGKKEKLAINLQSIATLISEGCVIDGNIKAPAFARIDGQVTGDVLVDEGLILGEKGSVSGNVSTKELVVYGEIKGNIHTNSLEIKATGKITGEIRTLHLVVENGAVYNGSLSMTPDSQIPESKKLNKPAQKVLEVG